MQPLDQLDKLRRQAFNRFCQSLLNSDQILKMVFPETSVSTEKSGINKCR